GKVAPNRLERNFHAKAPNQKSVTELTEFRLKGKNLYQTPLIELYNSEVI
ncbi:IS3 family transposase, partial [Vibrio cholerae]